MLCVIISVLCCARRVADCALCAQKGKSLTGKSTLWVSKKNWRSFLFCFTITYLVERRAIQIASGCFCKILESFILNSTSWMRLPLWNARTSLWQKSGREHLENFRSSGPYTQSFWTDCESLNWGDISTFLETACFGSVSILETVLNWHNFCSGLRTYLFRVCLVFLSFLPLLAWFAEPHLFCVQGFSLKFPPAWCMLITPTVSGTKLTRVVSRLCEQVTR